MTLIHLKANRLGNFSENLKTISLNKPQFTQSAKENKPEHKRESLKQQVIWNNNNKKKKTQLLRKNNACSLLPAIKHNNSPEDKN